MFSQRQTNLSRSEIGFLVGGTYYIGDLNQKHFNRTKPALSLIYRFNLHSRLTLRVNALYGNIQATDADATKESIRNRNLSFQTDIYELGAGVEYNYFPFQIGHERYRGTAYILYELAVARINPKTNYNGNLVELQSLGTEGQGTSESNKANYSLTQISIPIGVGGRISIGKNLALNVEYGIRFLFTDYLDDVGGYRYVDPVVLTAENGPIAADLSNRSLDGNRAGRRGNPTSRDWYSFAGIGLSYRLGRPTNCHFK